MLSTMGRQDSSLFTKSPKPGVSTTVRRRRTPASSISALMDWMVTDFGMMSRLGPLRSLGGYRDVLNSVLTSVDFPRHDSPGDTRVDSTANRYPDNRDGGDDVEATAAAAETHQRP